MIDFSRVMVTRLVQGRPAGVEEYLPRNYLSRLLERRAGSGPTDPRSAPSLRVVYTDNGGKSERGEGDFVETLRDLMRSWQWPEWKIERELPVVLKVCEGVGIIRAAGEGYEVTELVTSPSAWGLVTRHLKEAGLIGREGS